MTIDHRAMAWEEALERFGYHFTFQEIRRRLEAHGDGLLAAILPGDKFASHAVQIKLLQDELFARYRGHEIAGPARRPVRFFRSAQRGPAANRAAA